MSIFSYVYRVPVNNNTGKSVGCILSVWQPDTRKVSLTEGGRGSP